MYTVNFSLYTNTVDWFGVKWPTAADIKYSANALIRRTLPLQLYCRRSSAETQTCNLDECYLGWCKITRFHRLCALYKINLVERLLNFNRKNSSSKQATKSCISGYLLTKNL